MTKQSYIYIASEKEHEASCIISFNVMSFYDINLIPGLLKSGRRIFKLPQMEEVTEWNEDKPCG